MIIHQMATSLTSNSNQNKIFGTKHHFVRFCFANATIASVLTSVNSVNRKYKSTLLEMVNF